MTNARNSGATSFGRTLLAAALIALALPSPGCSIVPGPLKKLAPLGNSSDETLRKRVDADSFPPAKSIGLQSSDTR